MSIFDKILEQFKDTFFDRPDLVNSLYLFKGDSEFAREMFDAAIESYLAAINSESSFAEPYVALGQLYYYRQMYGEAITSFEAALSSSSRYFTWFRRDESYKDETIYDQLSCAYACVGDYSNAFLNVHKALFFDRTNERYLQNLAFIEEHLFSNMYKRAENSVGIV